MSAQRVIPSRAETEQHFARRMHERAHDSQHFAWVGEMLKRVQRNHNIGNLRRRSSEQACILDAGRKRLPSSFPKNVLADIDTDHAPSPFFSHFDDLGSGPAAEVDDNPPRNPGKEVIPQQNRKLRFVFVDGLAEVTRVPG
jgi:hypothetical protein